MSFLKQQSKSNQKKTISKKLLIIIITTTYSQQNIILQHQKDNYYEMFNCICLQSNKYNQIQQLKMSQKRHAIKQLIKKYSTDDEYKIIGDYKRVAESLQIEHSTNKINHDKVQELKKKVSCLQFMNSNSARDSLRYQRKLDKLQSTQKYAAELLKLKYQYFVKTQDEKNTRVLECLSKRQQEVRNREFSKSLHYRRKQERINRIKEEHERTSIELKRKSFQIEQAVKQKKLEVRTHELQLKEKRKRYQLFKLQQAEFNYHEKLANELENFKRNQQHLFDLKGKIKEQQQTFRKTQILNEQTRKMQSIYLTGAE